MTDQTPATESAITDVKHYVLALDKDGNEVKVEINEDGTFAQDVDTEVEDPTVH